MPRAHRYFVPGHVWHLTHRCHDGAFLLKFARDRRRWTALLFEARKRHGLTVLNYVVTRNHVHLLVCADGDALSIPRSMQFVAGQLAEEFNARKKRRGAFWSDRYHATAVESGQHLRRCMTYIDLNMVRAGAVNDPYEWEWSGYREIQDRRLRYQRIDRAAAARLLGLRSPEELASWQRLQVQGKGGECVPLQRRAEWTESVAVGGESYVQQLRGRLGMAVRHRRVRPFGDDGFVLAESGGAYSTGSVEEMAGLSPANTLRWDVAL